MSDDFSRDAAIANLWMTLQDVLKAAGHRPSDPLDLPRLRGSQEQIRQSVAAYTATLKEALAALREIAVEMPGGAA